MPAFSSVMFCWCWEKKQLRQMFSRIELEFWSEIRSYCL